VETEREREREERENFVSVFFVCRMTFVKNSSQKFVQRRFSLAKIKRQKRRRRDENLIVSFSKREKREISFSDLFSVIPEKKTSAK
jgi:hypothetical protein